LRVYDARDHPTSGPVTGFVEGDGVRRKCYREPAWLGLSQGSVRETLGAIPVECAAVPA